MILEGLKLIQRVVSCKRTHHSRQGPAKGLIRQGPAKGLTMAEPVEMDVLDCLDQDLIKGISRPGCNKHWCYIQCSTCNKGWIWSRKLNGVENWTLNCYICGGSWRDSYCQNGGWHYWNPILKRPE